MRALFGSWALAGVVWNLFRAVRARRLRNTRPQTRSCTLRRCTGKVKSWITANGWCASDGDNSWVHSYERGSS